MLTNVNKLWEGRSDEHMNWRKGVRGHYISNDPNTKEYYKNYCKKLAEVIIRAKNWYYNNLLLHYQNKQKSIGNIIKNLTNSSNKSNTNNIALMKIQDKG